MPFAVNKKIYIHIASAIAGRIPAADAYFYIYGMDVVEIPTNRPVQRIDLEDAVYMTKKESINRVFTGFLEIIKKSWQNLWIV
mgnify:CR=1 FL=1